MEIKRLSHCVYQCDYHVVICSKYSEIENQETKDLLKLAKLNWGT